MPHLHFPTRANPPCPCGAPLHKTHTLYTRLSKDQKKKNALSTGGLELQGLADTCLLASL